MMCQIKPEYRKLIKYTNYRNTMKKRTLMDSFQTSIFLVIIYIYIHSQEITSPTMILKIHQIIMCHHTTTLNLQQQYFLCNRIVASRSRYIAIRWCIPNFNKDIAINILLHPDGDNDNDVDYFPRQDKHPVLPQDIMTPPKETNPK